MNEPMISRTTRQSTIINNNNNNTPRRSTARPPPTLLPTIPRPKSSTPTPNPFNQQQQQQQHFYHHQSNQIKSNQIHQSNNTLPFQKLNAALNGTPHYLDQPGPQNRILLSIKSGIPEEIDYGLEILLAGSFYEPECIQLSRFPGLIESLLSLIDQYPSTFDGSFHHQEKQELCRRSIEASLILRNLILIEPFLRLISSNPKLPLVLLNGLEKSHVEVDQEFLSLLLEILESAATHGISLDQPLKGSSNTSTIRFPRSSLPVRLSSSIHESDPSSSNPTINRPPQWAQDLFARLDTLTGCDDRNLILGAYRCLAAFGRLAHNQATLGILTLDYLYPSPCLKPNWPTSISKGFQFLALPDYEILISLLDYLYSITSNSTISLTICSDFHSIESITKLLISHIQHQCKFELGPTQSLPIPSSQWYYERPKASIPNQSIKSNPQNPNQLHDPNQRGPPQTPTMTEVHKILLEDSEIGNLAFTPEPKRARDWMLRVFESDPNGEVQQVTLWLAYKTQFEAYLNKPAPNLDPSTQSNLLNHPPHSMIAPAEAIKLTSEVFRTACPSVQEVPNGEKRFIIKGIKARERIPPSDLLGCKWDGCKESSISGGPIEVYKHVILTHLSAQPEEPAPQPESEPVPPPEPEPATNPFQCKWHTCQTPKPNLNELKSHLSTHLISISKPMLGIDPQINRNEKVKFESFQTFNRSTPHGDPEEHGAIGIGYLSILVLRNLIKSVSEQTVLKNPEAEEVVGNGEGEEEELLGLNVLNGGYGKLENEILVWALEDRWVSGVACEVLGWLDLVYKRMEVKPIGLEP
ncbi:uncharacterized protein MELLADRAFT_102234 [Melampsora larici-populina 98AG31]|uniref:RFX-type winged-helix domain-containing protein n=1 Tax=Melampsora larici-populina (strain 98AG31 / pathotype 3-4-7) TaxID=747676 RepID=F4R7M4_MELLP|nr:uncharacterized protein MELLADRAFT_102234 [Melampsora larici-populina 98AG31]EGG11340.1 hypothetical protein MELLADRAFT_102234 [Melampsora larici-populina 98AG31]